MKAPQSDPPADLSDQPGDQSDRVKPWTVKGIPPEDRNAAIRAAERAGEPIGEWLRRAIREKVKGDRRRPGPTVPVDPAARRAALEGTVAMMREMAALTGAPPPAAISRRAWALLGDELRGIKAGPTAALTGPTEAGPQSDPEGARSDPRRPWSAVPEFSVPASPRVASAVTLGFWPQLS